MNKLELKQEKQKDKKKKKEKPEVVKITKAIMKTRLMNHFQNHIGEEEKTSQGEIFQAVTGVSLYAVDSWRRFYFWDSIEKVIRALRRKDICFIIKKKGHYFVLKSQEESDCFRGVCDRAITGMEKAQTRADSWVEQEKWKNMKVEEEIVKPEEPKPFEEKVEDKISDAEETKSKVLRLWKGENEDENKYAE